MSKFQQHNFTIHTNESGEEAMQSAQPENLGCSRIDVTWLCHPGVYEIYDTVTTFSYYGETSSLMSRLHFHRQQFESGSHENRALREAFLTDPTPNRMQFFVLESGPEWADRETRVGRQDEYIEANSNSNRCFNSINAVSPFPGIIRPFMANNIRFESSRDAEATLGIGRSQILRNLENPNNRDFYYLDNERQPYGCIPLFGKKENSPSVLFQSYQACIAAGFATNTQNARRKIQRREPGWRYAHLKADGKPKRTPYTLRSGEISYEQWIYQQSQQP